MRKFIFTLLFLLSFLFLIYCLYFKQGEVEGFSILEEGNVIKFDNQKKWEVISAYENSLRMRDLETGRQVAIPSNNIISNGRTGRIFFPNGQELNWNKYVLESVFSKHKESELQEGSFSNLNNKIIVPINSTLERDIKEGKCDVCELAVHNGTCDECNLRWYYEKGENKCKPFIWKGCTTNFNNFQTEEQCTNLCLKKKEKKEKKKEVLEKLNEDNCLIDRNIWIKKAEIPCWGCNL